MNKFKRINRMAYKYGITGFVDLSGDVARKYSEFDFGYWLKEYSTFLYLYGFRTNNIIRYKECEFISRENPEGADDDNVYYFTMVFKKYSYTLRDYKVYKDNTVIQVLLDILSALIFLHKHRIIHRDIKSDNILIKLTKKGTARAVLIDFSHSIRLRTKLEPIDGDVVTYPCRALELYEYKEEKVTSYNEKIDIWALGMVLMELVTKKPLHHIIKSRQSSAEKDWYAFIKSDFMQKFATLIEENHSNFVHMDVYFKWIKMMLEKDVNKRVSAVEMFNEVKKFAVDNKIKHMTPINTEGVEEKTTTNVEPKESTNVEPKESTNVEPKEQTIELAKFTQIEETGECIRLLDRIKYFIARDTYIDEFFVFHRRSVFSILYRMIQCKECTSDNWKPFTMALLIIIESTFYDNVKDIGKVSRKTNTPYSELRKCIIHIIQNYDKELFLYDTFDLDPIDYGQIKEILH